MGRLTNGRFAPGAVSEDQAEASFCATCLIWC